MMRMKKERNRRMRGRSQRVREIGEEMRVIQRLKRRMKGRILNHRIVVDIAVLKLISCLKR
jgi:hypothetical protein